VIEKLELLKDGTGIVDNQGVTWKTQGSRFYLTAPWGAKAVDYKLSGSVLTFTDNGTSTVYKRPELLERERKKAEQEAAKQVAEAKKKLEKDIAKIKRLVFKIKGVEFAFRLTNDFWMAETETTQAQWKAVMGNNPSAFKGDKLPVERVSWDDCQEFVKKLNAAAVREIPSGFKFSLPTEKQWEYACRAGSTTNYYFGDDEKQLGDYAWYGGNSEKKTHEVGTKVPNAWGLYDMHGNVWEWTDSASSGHYRVYRGGSWHYGAGDCRSASPSYDLPEGSNPDLGLRLALVPSK
jgi:hypothetical protein